MCTGSASALCGDTYSGNSCGGSCNAPAFPDTACEDKTLSTDALTLSSTLVRIGSPVDISWDMGTNHPDNCTLKGNSIPADFEMTSSTGTVTIKSVTGPHTYKLRCGPGADASRSATIRVLPKTYES